MPEPYVSTPEPIPAPSSGLRALLGGNLNASDLVFIGVFAAAAKLSAIVIALAGGGINPLALVAKNLIVAVLLVVLLTKVNKRGTLFICMVVSSIVGSLLSGSAVMLAPGAIVGAFVGEFFWQRPWIAVCMSELTAKASALAAAWVVLQNADHQLQMRTVWEEASAAWRLANRPKGRFVRMPPLREEGEEAVRRTLTRLGLLEFSSRHPQSLSGGQKQRLVIACAILKDPALLILDEPTSGLDGENLKKLAELLQSQARAGRAVLVVTHDEDLLAYCNSVIDVRDLMHGKAAAPTSD